MKNKKNFDDYIEGRWWKIKKNVKKNIIAKYDKIKDWKQDPKGYFLINIDKKSDLIKVSYCTFTKLTKNAVHEMKAEIVGKTAIEIVNTLINEKFITTMQHAADMGIELHKAELSLKHGFKYIQDKDLYID